MSKGSSHLFSGTSGEGKELIAEVKAKGEKITPEKVMLITKDTSGKIVWLEEGNPSSGFQHIVSGHGREFNGRGIANDEIPDYVLEAVSRGKIVGTQGAKNPRPIYEFTYNGKTQRIAVSIGENGYIVGANPVSMKEH